MLGMQKELLDAYEQASRAWLARVKSEVDLWTGVDRQADGHPFLPEALGTYQECVTQRRQMAAEDGRRMSEECQNFCKNAPARCPMSGRPVAAPEQGAILQDAGRGIAFTQRRSPWKRA
jgi:hypothetical protein